MRRNGVLLFRTQLSLILLPVIVLPLAFVGYFSYQISYLALQNRSAANVNQIALLVNQNLDTTLQQAIQQAKITLYDPNLQQIITHYAHHPELNISNVSLPDLRAIQDFSLTILIHNTNIDSVDIYTAGSTVFSETLLNFKPLPNWTTLPWFKQLMTSSSVRTLLLPTHVLQSDLGNRSVFSVVQAIVNTTTFETIGAIVINIDTQNTIEQIITASSRNTDTLFLVYGKDDQRIYATPLSGDPSKDHSAQPPQGAQLALQHAAQQALRQNNHQFTWENTDYFLSSNTSTLSDLTVAALVPSSNLTQDIEAIKQTTVLTICLTLALVFGCTLLIIYRTSQQLTQLRSLMTQVETGDLDARFQGHGRSELYSLGKSFNNMVTRLKQLIQDNYEAQLQRKQAELSALQSQINPHFLYNTLGSFQMMALMAGQERLATLSYRLGQLMRYSLEVGALVELGSEMEHAGHFLALMKERYEERLHYLIQVEDTVLSYKIPRFTLQPLIENAIYHGIDPRVEGGTVQVKGWQEERYLVLEVRDNGVGMPDEDIQRWQENLNYEVNILKRSRHIGTLNVQGQIQRIFGPAYGLSLAAGTGGGLVATIRLPICSQSESGEYQEGGSR